MQRNNKPARIIKGTAKQPTLKDASGVWSLDEAMQAHRANAWPQPNLFQPVANNLRTSSTKTSYLTRILTRSGNQTTWTMSCWFKRSSLGSTQVLWEATDSSGTSTRATCRFSSDSFQASDSSSGLSVTTTQVFRDTSAWYHIVLASDTTQSTNTNRFKLYVNGQQITSFSSATWPTQGLPTLFNSANCFNYIGATRPAFSQYFDGYIAEVNFIDGYQLDPSLFGKLDTNNTWVPIPYTGSYGTNGFYLPFANATTSQTLGYDASLTSTPTYDADQDPYRGSVALHLTGNGPAGGQNNTFVESSPNNHPITRSGSVTQGSFSPFPLPTNTPYNPAVHGASAYFGTTTSDNIYASPSQYNSSLAIGTNNFTVEFWANWTAWTGNQRFILMGQSGASNIEISRDDGTDVLRIYISSSIITYTWTPATNAWHHIAVVRTGTGAGQVTLYINGVSVATGTSATSISANNFFVGGLNWAAGYNMRGYISNVRVINGAAVYTTNFTPTNRPFGTLTNNLLPFSEDLTQSSTLYQATITANSSIAPDGTPSATFLSASASGTTYGFINFSNQPQSSTSTFSVYAKAGTCTRIGISNRSTNTFGAIFDLTTGTLVNTWNGAGTVSSTTITSIGNGWFRVSVTSPISVQYNIHPLSSSESTASNLNADTLLVAGQGIYVWGLQLEAVSAPGNYTPTPANFRTAPSLLLNFANAAVTDTAGGDNIITGSGATITSASKYGSGAMTFNGTSDYVAATSTTSYTFDTANFTVEYWVYFNSVAATQCVAAAYNSGGANATSPLSWTIRSNGVLSWEGNFGSIDFIGNGLTPIATVTANTWNHVATVRNNSEIIAFLNGRVVGRVSVGTGSGVAPAGGVHIGRAGQYNGQYFNGSVDDFRVTKGVARYQSDFTPPARALPETGGKSFVTNNVTAGVVQQFTTTGTTAWTAPTDVTQIEVLVVAGGGGGATRHPGGGGAGGLIYNNSYSITPGQTYTVIVGAGATAVSGGNIKGNNGSNSQFGNLIAIGGGAGGTYLENGYAGGSGGGGGEGGATTGGAGTSGQGFAGGGQTSGAPGNYFGGGGGGGAGGPGTSGNGSIAGSGGNGLQFGISGTPTYYAGGGGGAAYNLADGTGGLGGGGNGVTESATPPNGTANTGGGGGGNATGGGTSYTSGAGGSGVVIIRYTTTAVGNSSDATSDNLVDSPTLYGHDMGLGGEVVGNYATLNPLALPSGATLSNGNLTITGVTAYRTTPATIAMTSGKWYWENKLLTYTGSDIHIGVCLGNFTSFQGTWVLSTANGWGYTCQGGYGYHNNTLKNISSSARSTGDTIGIAFDADGGNLYAYVNGAVVNGGSPIYTGLTSGPYFPFVTTGDSNTNVAVNFGQRAWAYAPPAGYNAITTKNLPRPAVGSAAATPNQYFDAALYTGTGAAQTITLPGAFQPDLVWMKARSAADNHVLMDSVRGTSAALFSDLTNAEVTNATRITSFNSNGFTLGSSASVNTSSATYVAWCWKAGGAAVSNTSGTLTSQVSANTASGFSVVTYTGTATSGATVGHGLSAAPELIITKARNQTDGWYTYTTVIDGTMDYFQLNTDAGKGNSGLAVPTSTVFYNDGWSASYNMVAYCFHSVAGYSKIGTYVGNGSADGPFVYTGFKPRFVMIKYSSANGYRWIIWDTARDPINFATRGLSPNLAGAEVTAFDADILSNGFKLRDAEPTLNESSNTYIYMAIADKPFGNVNGTAR